MRARPSVALVLVSLLSVACALPSRSPAAPRAANTHAGAFFPVATGPGSSPPGSASGGATAASAVQWTTVAATNGAADPRWGPTLTDIMRHKPARERDHWADHATLGHEMSHGIHFELRLVGSAQRPMNGFYVLGGRGAVVAEPAFRKSAVAALVPPSLRRGRYATYLTGQAGWDARPLYVWDEWTAYVNGGMVAVERYEQGLEPHVTTVTSDRVFAVLELTVYAATVLLAASQIVPATLSGDQQLRSFFAHNAERAMQLFQRGKEMPPFRWDDSARLLAALRAAPDAEALRQCLRNVYGAPWTQVVFGF